MLLHHHVDSLFLCDCSTSLGATGIVHLAVITRLEMTRPYIKRWPEALAVMAHPTNTVMSFTQLGKLVDDIWYYAGDKSPDVSTRTMMMVQYIC